MESNEVLKYVIESNVINFTIAAVVIVVFLTKFLPGSTKQRQEELEREINAAKQAKLEAEEKLRELELEIERAKTESKQIIENAKASSDKIKKDILDEAKYEIAKLNELAIQEIDLQRNTAMESLRKEIAHKVYELSQKAILENSSKIDQSIRNKTIRELEEAKA
jgi:F-type H+-transporting ATPase subunit b